MCFRSFSEGNVRVVQERGVTSARGDGDTHPTKGPSNATKELDSLMTSLTDFKVRLICMRSRQIYTQMTARGYCDTSFY